MKMCVLQYGKLSVRMEKIGMKKWLTPFNIKRFIIMLFGNALLGVGVSLLRLADFGTDPFACMNIGVSSHLPIGYGTYQMLLNAAMFVVVIILYPQSFGIGAFINMVGLGYEVEFCMWLCEIFGVTIASMSGLYVLRVLFLFAGIAIICLGVALYVQSNMGIAPYDVAGVIVEKRTHGKISFRATRVTLDIIAIIIGWISGGPVGFATVVVGFFTGPLVTWFKVHCAEKLLPEQTEAAA